MTTETASAEAGVTDSAPAAPVRARRRLSVRSIIFLILGVVIVGAAANYGYNYWRDSTLFISTDDALVDSDMTTVTPTGAGTLVAWPVKVGEKVRAGQVIGLVQTAPGTATRESFNITAPINGTLLRVDAKQGQLVSAGVPLAYIADLDHLRITAFVDETAISDVRVGQPADITVDATGNTTYSGTVTEILPATAAEFSLLPATDRGTANFTKVAQRIEVHISLNAPADAALYPGESANVRIRR
ncbi:MAG TPA: HlyD family efflux transporter periplasmic adaptor subunit [Roseiflexaceae bacterium]|jgi:multidrug resistance efflux pump|nr:HlyD family efflux transporter periplasmic adaptor subunit [Roseiflexaceae bacterium]